MCQLSLRVHIWLGLTGFRLLWLSFGGMPFDLCLVCAVYQFLLHVWIASISISSSRAHLALSSICLIFLLLFVFHLFYRLLHCPYWFGHARWLSLSTLLLVAPSMVVL